MLIAGRGKLIDKQKFVKIMFDEVSKIFEVYMAILKVHVSIMIR